MNVGGVERLIGNRTLNELVAGGAAVEPPHTVRCVVVLNQPFTPQFSIFCGELKAFRIGS